MSPRRQPQEPPGETKMSPRSRQERQNEPQEAPGAPKNLKIRGKHVKPRKTLGFCLEALRKPRILRGFTRLCFMLFHVWNRVKPSYFT